MTRVISIVNEKGGSGKTTTAVSLGVFLTKFGKKVLLIDLDPQANATISLGFVPKKIPVNVYHSLVGEVPFEETIKNTAMFNFDIVPSNSDLAGSNIELLDKMGRERILSKILKPVIKKYDYILIDTPPSLGILTLNSLVAAKEIIIPIQCEFFALKSLDQLFEVLELLEKNLSKNFKQIFGLLTMYDRRNILSREIAKRVRENFRGKIKVFETIIPR
ncbi:MAG: AAA family ATPase, partial [Candidatus Bathyarchaeota archaeon]|nr:AAA family ATPase [Candidatus Bathyarchaeota archaeon]